MRSRRRSVLVAAFVLTSFGVVAQQLEPSTVYLVLGGPDASALYHRQDCPHISKGGLLTAVPVADARARYFQPHCSCVFDLDGEPPCKTPLAALNAQPASGGTSPPIGLRSPIGLTQAQVLATLGNPSVRQIDTWYYDLPDLTTMRLSFMNGAVSKASPEGMLVPTTGGAATLVTRVPATTVSPAVKKAEPTSAPPSGATAICRDGTYSYSKSRSGTCSGHGGVARWL